MSAGDLYEVRFDPSGDDFSVSLYELPKAPLTLRETAEQLSADRLSGGEGVSSKRFEIIAGELRRIDGTVVSCVYLLPRNSGRPLGAGASVGIFAMDSADRIEPVARTCLQMPRTSFGTS